MADPLPRPHAPKITRRTLSDAVYVCARCRKRGGTLKKERGRYVCDKGCKVGGAPHSTEQGAPEG